MVGERDMQEKWWSSGWEGTDLFSGIFLSFFFLPFACILL
jgi:hypothetical protein